MTKIDIFSGFLGAGKTTLIKKLIADAYAGEKLVLIENEFGEIGIDGAFMQEAGIEVTEMNSGCICCSLVGDFTEALKKVLDKYHPDRILIEPSGVGKLTDVKRAVSGVITDDVIINSCVTVVDAKKARLHYKNFGEFYTNQIIAADCVVLSRSQDISDEKLEEALEIVRGLNADASVVAAPWDTLSGADFMDAIESRDTLAASLEALKAEIHDDDDEHEHHHHHHDDDDEDAHEHHRHQHDDDDEDEHEHHHHHHDDDDEDEHHHHHHHHDHDADEVFQSWGIETMHRFTEDELKEKLSQLDDETAFGVVLRAKGVVPAADGEKWIHFDYVPEEMELRRGAASVIGRLCVIGSKINEQALKALFNE